jgi:hypothetical protein
MGHGHHAARQWIIWKRNELMPTHRETLSVVNGRGESRGQAVVIASLAAVRT